MPAPEVIHDKFGHSKADLYSPNVTLIAGGKALLDKAVLRLARTIGVAWLHGPPVTARAGRFMPSA